MKIRMYKNSDYEILYTWWLKANEPAPLPGMLPENSTFILEENNKPLASICIYFTNTKEIAYLENLVKDPEFKNKQAIQQLVEFSENFAKELGYKRLICLTRKEKLKNRYQELGYQKTLDNLSSFVKEI